MVSKTIRKAEVTTNEWQWNARKASCSNSKRKHECQRPRCVHFKSKQGCQGRVFPFGVKSAPFQSASLCSPYPLCRDRRATRPACWWCSGSPQPQICGQKRGCGTASPAGGSFVISGENNIIQIKKINVKTLTAIIDSAVRLLANLNK